MININHLKYLQIVKDWIWMSKLIKQMQNDQKDFVSRIQDMLEHKSKRLEQNINTSLEEIFKKNDQRSQEMKLRIEIMQEGIQSLKTGIQSILQTSIQHHSSELDGKAGDEVNQTDSSAQTDIGMRKNIRVDETASSLRKVIVIGYFNFHLTVL